MPILSPMELAELRRRVAKKASENHISISWVKSQINTALQSIEDRWEAPATQQALSSDIETAAPGVFSSAEKRFLSRYWLQQKAEREEELL